MSHKLYAITVSTKNMGTFFEKIAVLTTSEYDSFIAKTEKMGFTVKAYVLEYTCDCA